MTIRIPVAQTRSLSPVSTPAPLRAPAPLTRQEVRAIVLEQIG